MLPDVYMILFLFYNINQNRNWMWPRVIDNRGLFGYKLFICDPTSHLEINTILVNLPCYLGQEIFSPMDLSAIDYFVHVKAFL